MRKENLFIGCLIILLGAHVARAEDNSRAPANDAEQKSTYRIGPDDALVVNVWKEPELSRGLVVRPDGKISLPLVGEVQAAGLTPTQLEQDLRKRLASFVGSPETTVIVQESRSQRYNVLGEVQRPGTYALKDTTTVMDAIAAAGGFRDFAKTKKIYVLRTADHQTVRLKFNYKEVARGRHAEQNVRLEHGDTLVVP